MRRILVTIAMAAIGTAAVGVGIALAADVEISPSSPGEGVTELTIDVTGFASDTPIFAVPCDVPAAGEVVDIATDGCDIAQVATATTDTDGAATILVEWNIPAEGIAVFVGDEAGDNEVTTLLMPGVEQVDIDGPEADDSEVAVLGTNVVQEDLADTGPREVMVLLMVATILMGLGVALVGAQRTHRTT